MPNQLSLTVGATTVSVPLKGTATKISAALQRYAMSKGIPTEGRSAEEIGTDVLTHLISDVRHGAMDQQRETMRREHAASLEQTLASDNDL